MFYDYKLKILTQEVYIKNIIPIVDDIIDEYNMLGKYDYLSIYVTSNVAKEIINNLLKEAYDIWIHSDSIDYLLCNEYEPILITLGYDGMLFIESLKNQNGLIKSNKDCKLTYYYDELSKKDLDTLEENAESILVFGFEDDDYEGCTEEDENIELPTTSNKTHYYVNGKEVSKQTWEKEQKLINDEIETFGRGFWNVLFGF